MPTLTRDEASVYYETHGTEGPPLLLVNGIGFSCWSWYLQVSELQHHFRIVAFDNRGSGGSPLNGRPFTVEDLADDAAAVLDALGIERAHVLGISMGGFIAQEIALRHPERLLSLNLCCTHCGAPEAIFMEQPVVMRMTQLARMGWKEDGVRASLDLNFSDAFIAEHPDFLDDYVQRRVHGAPTTEGWMAQRESSLRWRSHDRLGSIKVPTRIYHGDADRVVPVANADIIAKAISGSTVRRFAGSRHGFFMENAGELNQDLIASYAPGGS